MAKYADILKYIYDYVDTCTKNGKITEYILLELYEVQEFFECSYDGSKVTRKQYNKAVKEVNELLENTEYYCADGGKVFIQLSANWTLHNLPDSAKYIDDDIFSNIYDNLVRIACQKFYVEAGIRLYCLGRSGRHICVEDTVENAIKYKKLQRIQAKLEKEVIDRLSFYGEIARDEAAYF